METVYKFVWAVLPSLLVGIVVAVWSQKQKQRDSKEEEMRDARQERDMLMLKLVTAGAKLSYATAIAMKRGYANGEVEDGVKSYQTAKASLEEFERKQTAERLVT